MSYLLIKKKQNHHNTSLLNNKIFKRFHPQQPYANKFLININSQKLKKKSTDFSPFGNSI